MSEMSDLLEQLRTVQAQARAHAHTERSLEELKREFEHGHKGLPQYIGYADSWIRGRVLRSHPGGHEEFERGMIVLMAPETKVFRGEIIRDVYSLVGNVVCMVPDHHLRPEP